MNYCTVQDLIDAFGEQEIRQLSDRGNSKPVEIDTDTVNRAIESASVEISMYIGGRNIAGDTIPAVLKRIACDIARFYLYKNVSKDSPVSLMRDSRLSQLKDMAKGLLNPGVDAGGQLVEPETTVQFSSGTLNFRNGNRGGLW